jgi:hypothetical protein
MGAVTEGVAADGLVDQGQFCRTPDRLLKVRGVGMVTPQDPCLRISRNAFGMMQDKGQTVL